MSAEARGKAAIIIGYVLGGLVIAIGIAAVPTLRTMRADLQRETVAAREAQRTGASARDSLAAELQQLRASVELERARAAARMEPKLHLVIAVDSGTVALMRDGVALRTVPARFRGATPERGTRTISRIAAAVVTVAAPTVDSMGNRIAAVAPDTSVKEVTLDDGTIIAAGDAASVLLGGSEPAPGRRAILISKRDFDAIRPSFARGMKAVLF